MTVGERDLEFFRGHCSTWASGRTGSQNLYAYSPRTRLPNGPCRCPPASGMEQRYLAALSTFQTFTVGFCPDWHGSVRRRTPTRPSGATCRTRDRTDSSKLPSLWHGAPSVVSQPSLEVPGSSPISRLSPRSTLILNQGPFPPPTLLGFDSTMGLSDSPTGRAFPSRAAR
jgi:hypothetical protein